MDERARHHLQRLSERRRVIAFARARQEPLRLAELAQKLHASFERLLAAQARQARHLRGARAIGVAVERRRDAGHLADRVQERFGGKAAHDVVRKVRFVIAIAGCRER